jgi:pyridoxal phosphate enzyme (YggS family)
MDIAKNIAEIKKSLPEGLKLVAVSKKKSPEIIMQAYHAGHKIFGENKAQDLVHKYEKLPKDIEWHFIGHLQTNKAKYLVDSFKILKTVNKEAQKNNRTIPCLLQFHIAQESSKFGLSEEEAHEILDSEEYKTLKNISIVGVMGMATFTDDEMQVRNEFRFLKRIFDKLKKEYFPRKKGFKEISMGMSDDYSIAVEEGSTMVRVGSKIFGAR